MAMWVLIKNVYKRECKGKRRKRDNKKGITTLGFGDDDDRNVIRCWRVCAMLFARVSFVTQSLPLVTPLGALYGNSSRKFMIFCAGTSGGQMSQWVS